MLILPEEVVVKRIGRYENGGLEAGRHNWFSFGAPEFPVCLWAPHDLAPTEFELQRTTTINREAIDGFGITPDQLEDMYDAYTGVIILGAGPCGKIVSNRPRLAIDQNRGENRG